MTQILVTKPSVLNQRDRATLRRAGVVTVEAENPADVKLIQASGQELPASDMLYAAMSAINADRYSANVRTAFTKALMVRFDAMRAAQQATDSDHAHD